MDANKSRAEPAAKSSEIVLFLVAFLDATRQGAVMAQITKVVKFYEPLSVDQNDKRKGFKDGFWSALAKKLNNAQPAGREHTYSNITYYGESRTAKRPAAEYVYVGRLRPPADHPDTYRPGSGITGPLQPVNKGDRISEPTYLLPFGTKNYVSVMSPVTGATRVGALDSWLNAMAGSLQTSNRIELAPIIDRKTFDKLKDAIGATKLYVRIPDGVTVPQSGGGRVGDAIREAAAKRIPGAYVDITWSFGHARGTDANRRGMLNAVRWIANAGWAEKVEVNLQIPEADGYRTEFHEILLDRVTLRGEFDVPDGQVPSERAVLTSMTETIEQFRRQM
jgi:hypothetical protein